MMNSLRPTWYTVEDLAKLWGTNVTTIDTYIQSNQLVLSERWIHEDIGERWVDCGNDNSNLYDRGFEFAGKYVRLKDAERFEKEHPLVVGGAQEKPGEQPLHNAKEDFPGESGEKAVDGYKGIGEFFSRSAGHIEKHWSKEKGFPLNSSPEGRVYAYPSRLNIWRASRPKKPKKVNTVKPFTKKV